MGMLCTTLVFIFAEEGHCLAADDDPGESLPRDKLIQDCFRGIRDLVP